MKVTYNWLQEYVDIPWTPEETAERLTMAGLEVEELTRIDPVKENVIIGKVLSVEPISHSDKLSICVVDTGKGHKTIVCGAPNVKKGMFVPIALPGAVLINGEKIQVTKIAGIESYGMICSEYELGISDISDVTMELTGDIKAGDQFRSEEFQSDWIYDISITPNRPDCLGVIGVAREIAALSGQKIRKPEINISENYTPEETFSIEIAAPGKCPRYSARILDGIKVKPSPVWIINRLNLVGARAINNVVDVTNYVMMETGQPLHAFDYQQLAGNKIVVKCAENHEEFVTLDNVIRTLNSNSLLICDAEKGVALAGIMGGLNSEVYDTTSKVLLESATFNPPNIRKTSKMLGLTSEASRRFERGTDPEITVYALDRVCQILKSQIEDIKISGVYDKYPGKKEKEKILFRPERANKILGTGFSQKEMIDVLLALELKVESKNEVFEVEIPSFRHDLTREIDLIEEISRILGFNQVGEEITLRVYGETEINLFDWFLNKIRDLFIQVGFDEVITYSMIDEKFNKYFENPEWSLFLKNPINKDTSMMRRSLLPGLLNVLSLNINRNFENIRIFEIGRIYKKDSGKQGEIIEENCLTAIIEGKTEVPMWQHKEYDIDIYYIKGILETFFGKIFLDNYEIFYYDKSDFETCYCIKTDEEIIGFFGTFNNGYYEYTFERQIFVIELFLDRIISKTKKDIKYKPLKIYPSVFRDIAVVVDDSVSAGQLRKCIKTNGGKFLKNVKVFDVYRSGQIGANKKSIGFSLEFYSSERTLEENEIEPVFNTIIQVLKEEYNADLRK